MLSEKLQSVKESLTKESIREIILFNAADNREEVIRLGMKDEKGNVSFNSNFVRKLTKEERKKEIYTTKLTARNAFVDKAIDQIIVDRADYLAEVKVKAEADKIAQEKERQEDEQEQARQQAQRQSQQRESQQREAQQRADQQREARQRADQQREALQREALQREVQQRADQQREAQQREAQQRADQQSRQQGADVLNNVLKGVLNKF